jgi:hypothetical protein
MPYQQIGIEEEKTKRKQTEAPVKEVPNEYHDI